MRAPQIYAQWVMYSAYIVFQMQKLLGRVKNKFKAPREKKNKKNNTFQFNSRLSADLVTKPTLKQALVHSEE